MKVEDSKKPLNAAIRQAFNENPQVSSIHQPEFQIILGRVHELLPGWECLTYDVLREKASRYLYYYRYWTKKRTSSGNSFSNLDDSLSVPSSCSPVSNVSAVNKLTDSCDSNPSTNISLSITSHHKKQSSKNPRSYMNELVREVCQNVGDEFYTHRKQCILKLAGKLRNLLQPEHESLTDEELQKKITRFMYNSRRIPKLKATASRTKSMLQHARVTNGPNISNSNSPSSLSDSDVLCIKHEMSDSYYEDSITEFDSCYSPSAFSHPAANGSAVSPSASSNYYIKPVYGQCVRPDDARSVLKRKSDVKARVNPKQLCSESALSLGRGQDSSKSEILKEDSDPANDSFDLDDNLLMTNMEKMEFDKHDINFEDEPEAELSDTEGDPDKSYHRFMFRRRNMRRRLVKRRSGRLARPDESSLDDKSPCFTESDSSARTKVELTDESIPPKTLPVSDLPCSKDSVIMTPAEHPPQTVTVRQNGMAVEPPLAQPRLSEGVPESEGKVPLCDKPVWKMRTGDQVDVMDGGVQVAAGILAAPVSDLIEDEKGTFSCIIMQEKLRSDIIMPFLNESNSWNKLKVSGDCLGELIIVMGVFQSGDWFFWPTSKIRMS